MASFSVTNVDFRSATFNIKGLENPANKYDKFVFHVYQNGVLITDIIWNSSSTSKSFSLSLTNDEYYGLNWFSPGCSYWVLPDACWEGTLYPLNGDGFTTDSIEPPSGTILPSVYVAVREQNGESCVAQSLACAMDIFKAKNTGIKYENFSASYIWGNGAGYQDGMWIEDAIDNCMNLGSPRWEICEDSFPDNLSFNDSVTLFNSADSVVADHADKQKFSSKENIDFYDCSSVANYIKQYGYFCFSFRKPKNFDKVGSDGIVSQPNQWTGKNHTIALIGLITINDKKYWMAQNSWGEGWGMGGRCYIPCDWGCGVQSPIINGIDNTTSWTLESYGIGGNYTTANPTAAYNLQARADHINKQVTLSWDSDETGDVTYMVLARSSGTSRWYRKDLVSEKYATVDVNNYDNYEFMIITIKDSCCSPQSEIVTIGVGLEITNLSLSHSYRCIACTWDGAWGSSGFEVILTRIWDGNTVTKTVYDRKYEFNDLDFGVQYSVTVQAFDNNGNYGSEIIKTITTAPSPPVITLSQSNGYITVNYGVEDITNIDKIYLDLYNSSDEYIEVFTVRIEDGDQNPSGTHTYSFQCEVGQKYYVKAMTALDVGGFLPLKGYTFDNKIYVIEYITITDSERPENWNWEIGTNSDKDKAYKALRNKGYITDFTADTWNDLIDKVLKFVEYKKYSSYQIGESKYGFSSTATLPQLLAAAKMTNSDKEMTARRFNLVRYCIGNINPFGTGTNSIKTHADDNDGRWDMNPGEEILGDYFLDLVTYLNGIK